MKKRWMPALGILKGVNHAVEGFSEFERGWMDHNAKRMATYLNRHIKGDELTALKLEYGSKKALSDLTKGCFMLSISLLTGTVLEASLVILTYRSIVSLTRSVHANTSMKCLGFSLFFFTLLPILCRPIEVGLWQCTLVFCLMTAAILRYVPVMQPTFKEMVEEKQIKRTQKKAIFRTLVIVLLAALCPIKLISTMILIGLLVALIAILPITQKMMNGEI